MDIRAFFTSEEAKFVYKNIGIAVGVVLVGVISTLIWLRHYTEHGVEMVVPNLIGMQVDEAGVLADSIEAKVLVIDSTFSTSVPLGTIVEQSPMENSHVKRGRTIYVVVNARFRPQVLVPDVHDLSFRQAEASLRAAGLVVVDYAYEPSEFKNIVLDVRHGGVSIEPGTRITEGAGVVIVIGKGQGTEKVAVPNLSGKTLAEARQLLLGSYLTLGSYAYDEAPKTDSVAEYVIYRQDPSAGTMILEGSGVSVQLSTDIEKAVTVVDTKDEEDFF